MARLRRKRSGVYPRVAAGFGAEPHLKRRAMARLRRKRSGVYPRVAAGFGAEPHL